MQKDPTLEIFILHEMIPTSASIIRCLGIIKYYAARYKEKPNAWNETIVTTIKNFEKKTDRYGNLY